MEDNTDHDLSKQNTIHLDNGFPQMSGGGETITEGTKTVVLLSNQLIFLLVHVTQE